MLRRNSAASGGGRTSRAALLALAVASVMIAWAAWPDPLRGQQPAPGAAKSQAPSQPNQPSQQAPGQKGRDYTINVDVNLVVLHATVLDRRGRTVDDLKQDDFRVYEDGVPQRLSVFTHADIPVTMGIVIDDSGSMREKRPAVNAASLSFVKTSNVQDQVFVVNFNDVYYLDTPGDFASSLEDLKAALDKIDSRGGTALYDAVNAAIDHLKLGNRDKKVLLVITDGEDNASRYSLEDLVRRVQKSNVVIYSIGLLGEEEPGGIFKAKGGGPKHAAKVLKELAEVTGGQAYFPKSLDEVEQTCVGIAHDIRNQYTLAYYPTNSNKDGTFRAVRVEAVGSDRRGGGAGKLMVRTKTGYYAPRTAAVASSGQ